MTRSYRPLRGNECQVRLDTARSRGVLAEVDRILQQAITADEEISSQPAEPNSIQPVDSDIVSPRRVNSEYPAGDVRRAKKPSLYDWRAM